jgi:hypothetical protein
VRALVFAIGEGMLDEPGLEDRLNHHAYRMMHEMALPAITASKKLANCLSPQSI